MPALLGALASSQLAVSASQPGQVVSWGREVLPYVLPATRLSQIAAGGYHSLALESSGVVAGWNANFCGQATPPGGVTNAVGLAAGWYHSLALKSDGTVAGWGDSSRRVDQRGGDRRELSQLGAQG